MNKYQEALKVLYENIDCSNNFYLDNLISKNLEIISELVEKEKPKKIIKIDKKDIDGVRKESITDIVGYMCECPNCEKRFGWLSISPYCRHCGQRLGDEDDK